MVLVFKRAIPIVRSRAQRCRCKRDNTGQAVFGISRYQRVKDPLATRTFHSNAVQRPRALCVVCTFLQEGSVYMVHLMRMPSKLFVHCKVHCRKTLEHCSSKFRSSPANCSKIFTGRKVVKFVPHQPQLIFLCIGRGRVLICDKTML